MPRDQWLLVGLLLASLVFQTAGVVRWNAGAPYDTAHKGIETFEEVLQGNVQPFYRHYNGQPPLMDWILAIIFLTVGVSAVTLHMVGTISGLLATWLWYAVGKSLWSRRAGLYAAALGLTSHWFLLETREGTHNIPLVPVLLLALLAVIWMYRLPGWKGRYGAAVVGGLAAGSLAYIYAAGWIFMAVLAIMLSVMLVAAWVRPAASRQRWPLLLMIIIMAGAWLPFVQYAQHDSQIVTMHADDEIRTRVPGELAWRMVRNLVPMAGAFFYLPFGPLANWEDNATVRLGPLPLFFPVPLILPGGAVLLVASLGLIIWGWWRRDPMWLPVFLVLMILVALVPNLLTTGAQPHYRRTVCAMVPLFLLMGWAAARIQQEFILPRGPGWRATWTAFMAATLVSGPMFYFFMAQGAWFATNYQTAHDAVAPYLFARVAAGQRVTLAGNTAHMKSFQFYALASPAGRSAFQLLNVYGEQAWPPDVLRQTDVLFYVSPQCAQEHIDLPGFLPLRIMSNQFGVMACVYDRPGVSQALIQAREPLPSSGPLWSAWLHRLPPLQPHSAFMGQIFGS